MSQTTAGAAWRAAIGARGEHRCARCGERFARPGYLTLHAGRRHQPELDATERAAFETVRAAEAAWMEHFAGHVKSGLVVVPLFLVWAMTLVLLYEMDANIAWLVMSTPGYVFFGVLLYVMAYGYLTGGREDYHGRSAPRAPGMERSAQAPNSPGRENGPRR